MISPRIDRLVRSLRASWKNKWDHRVSVPSSCDDCAPNTSAT